MRKIVCFTAMLLGYHAQAAEVFDAFSYSGEFDNVISYTWNHVMGTCSGNSHGAIVVITSATSNAHTVFSGVTAGGAAMSQVGFVDQTNSTTVVWKLADPPTGTIAIVVSRSSSNVGNLAVGYSACGISATVVRAGSFVTNTVSGSNNIDTSITPTVATDLDVIHNFCQARTAAADAFTINAQSWFNHQNFQAGQGNDNVDLDLLSGMWAPNSTATLTLHSHWGGAQGCSAVAFSFDLQNALPLKHRVIIQ